MTMGEKAMRKTGLLAILITATPLSAQSTPPESQEITVLGMGDHGYKLTAEQLRNAVQAFEQNRASLAPAAQLVWQITPQASASGIALALRGQDESLPIPIAPDGTFTLPHDKVLSGQWRLVSTASKSAIHIRPRAQSPGSTLEQFRFGDAQLTCRVAIGFVWTETNFLMRGVFKAAGGCTSPKLGIYFSSEKPIASIAIDHWDKQTTIAKTGKAWRVPLYDKTISNEDLVHITYRQP